MRTKTFVQEIRQKSFVLEQHPGMGRAGRIIGTRELVVHKNYVLIYRVRSERVEVIEVLHTAKKFP